MGTENPRVGGSIPPPGTIGFQRFPEIPLQIYCIFLPQITVPANPQKSAIVRVDLFLHVASLWRVLRRGSWNLSIVLARFCAFFVRAWTTIFFAADNYQGRLPQLATNLVASFCLLAACQPTH